MTGLADLTWPAVARRASTTILAVPLGSTEQHGPHLPLSTDTDIASALAGRLALARDDVLVGPAVPYGASGEHAGFAGTLSIGLAAVELLVLELVRSATDTFGHVVLVSAHGGNSAAVTKAVSRLRHEGRDVLLHEPRWPGEPHAGRAETGLMLAIRPAGVDMALAEPGDIRPLSETGSLLRTAGVRGVSANGILGNPVGSTAAEGIALLDRLARDLIDHVDAWRSATVAAAL